MNPEETVNPEETTNSEETCGGARILMVDDEESFLEMAAEALSGRDCEVIAATGADEAMALLDTELFDVVVLDVRMPGMDGMSLLRKLSRERPTLQVVMLSGHATVPVAVEAVKMGAFEFLQKPLKVDKFVSTIRRAAERARLERSNLALEGELERITDRGPIVGECSAMQEVFNFIKKAAASDLPVLVTGESGTGKELVARAIHENSPRSEFPLVVVDGSTLKEELLASELFGHEKGAFTGAVRKKVGLFEVANRGSIFLDEVGELSPANQVALLRVIEYGTFRPVGAVNEVHTDVRIIAATNKDLSRCVERGDFRNDLFYRLKGMMITLPALRERKEDISLLARHFLSQLNTRTGKRYNLSREVVESLGKHSWPGNVRELRYVIELAALSAEGDEVIKPRHLPEELGQERKESLGIAGDASIAEDQELTLEDFRYRFERAYVSRLLDRFNGNKSRVAKVLGVSSSVFYRMLRRLKLFEP